MLNRFIFFITFLFSTNAYGQLFLEFGGYNNKTLGAGIVENNYLLITIKPDTQFNIVLNNTLFVEKFVYQNFYLKFYYNFYSLDDFDFYITPSLIGSYKRGFKYFHILFSSQSRIFQNLIFGTDIITNFSKSKNIYTRLGLQYSFVDKFNIMLKYGLPSFSFPEDYYLAPGITFKDDNLIVEVLAQIPTKEDNIKYIRITTSFLLKIF